MGANRGKGYWSREFGPAVAPKHSGSQEPLTVYGSAGNGKLARLAGQDNRRAAERGLRSSPFSEAQADENGRRTWLYICSP